MKFGFPFWVNSNLGSCDKAKNQDKNIGIALYNKINPFVWKYTLHRNYENGKHHQITGSGNVERKGMPE
jgi:hypothetical protein